MKVEVALRETNDAETELAAELLRVGQRHKADHDVYHLTRTLSTWCDRHVRRLAVDARRYELELEPSRVAEQEQRGLLGRVRERGAELAGRQQARPEAGLLLLRDLRDLHLAAARAFPSCGERLPAPGTVSPAAIRSLRVPLLLPARYLAPRCSRTAWSWCARSSTP